MQPRTAIYMLTALVALLRTTTATPFDTETAVAHVMAGVAGGVAALSDKVGAPATVGLTDAHTSAPIMPVKLADWKKFTADLKCGADIGMCPPGFCCSAAGLCGQTKDACGRSCQLHYSGPGSACEANLPAPLVSTDTLGKTVGDLPPVPSGGVCGVYVGACSAPGECCSQFGICTNSSYFCSIPSCVRAASPHSPRCQAVWDRVKPVVRKYKLVATWGRANPDGVERDIILLNGKFPGPTFRGSVGDRIIVEYYNLLNEPSSIHWHGIRQISTSLSDGVPPVVQREIGAATGPASRAAGNPNATAPAFTYDFTLDSSGSFWYHSHSSVQYMDGLRGALIVDDPYALDPYSENHIVSSPVVFATDWNWNTTAVLLPYAQQGGNNNTLVSTSTLVNGWGQTRVCRAAGTCRVPVLRGTPSTCGSPKTRMRLISGAGSDPINITLFPTDGSQLETYLVGMDGVRLHATNVTGVGLYLAAGQRLGIVPCTGGGQPPSAEPVWVRVRLVPGGGVLAETWALLDMDGRYPTDETESMLLADAPPRPAGEVHDKQAASSKAGGGGGGGGGGDGGGGGSGGAGGGGGGGDGSGATTIATPPQPIVEPLGDLVPPTPTKTINFTVGVDSTTGTNLFTINGISLLPQDDGPSLIELIYGPGYTQPPPGPGAVGWNVFDNKLGDVVEIVIRNFGGKAPHPFHTHGHWMLVKSVNGYATDGVTPGGEEKVLLARDVIAVAPNSTMRALYIVDNPSTWIVHCHIDWHLVKGLGWIFRDGI